MYSKKCERNTFLKKVMLSCTLRVISRNINKPRISEAFVHYQESIIPVIFFEKREISFEVSTFGGLLFSGRTLLSEFVMNTFDILLLLPEVRYFRGVVIFGT